ncbi:MAG: EAL domain-containing protein [Pseudomonadales bacterium]|nr:EAL domain-containing protein [Pseudomonadales bacterium]
MVKEEPETILDTHQQHISRNMPLLLLLLLGLLAVTLFPPAVSSDLANYLPLHTLMESLAVVVSVLIFAVCWNAYETTRLQSSAVIACAFVGVAILDFSHALSFSGMPAFITPSSPEKAIHFWLAARLFAASGLLTLTLMSWHKTEVTSTRNLLLALTLLLVLAIHLIIFFAPELIPTMYEEPRGLTATKLGIEYLVIALHLITAFIIWHRRSRPGLINPSALFTAVAIMAMSELLFTLYTQVSDGYNLIGHLYKIIAYLFLYKALVFTAITVPFQQAAQLQNRLQATLDALPDMMFEISADGIVHNFHSGYTRLLASPEEFLHRNLFDFIPEQAVDACHQSIRDIDQSGYSMGRQYWLDQPGGRRWYEISGRAVETGKFPENRYILLVRDITERHLEEKRTQALFDLTMLDRHLDENALIQHTLAILKDLIPHKLDLLHEITAEGRPVVLYANSPSNQPVHAQETAEPAQTITAADICSDSTRAGNALLINSLVHLPAQTVGTASDCRINGLAVVPIQVDGQTRMLLGIGGFFHDFNENDIKSTRLLGTELVRIILARRLQRELDQSHEFIQTALDNLPIGVAMNTVGDEVHFSYMNERFAEIYGTTRQALTDSSRFWEIVYEDKVFREDIRKRVITDSQSGDARAMIWHDVPITRNGEVIRYVTAQNIPLPEQHLVLSLATDVTERIHAQRELSIAAIAFESQEAIMITDAAQKILKVNRSFTESSGYTEAEIKGRTPTFLQSGLHDENFYQTMWQSLKETGVWRGEIWNKRKNGQIYPQKLCITAVRNKNEEVVNYVAGFIEITAIKQAEDRIHQLVYYDPLTGLANRQQLMEKLQQQIEESLGLGHFGALLYIDLDQFKNINDTLGHDAGDKLLVQVAHRLSGLSNLFRILARNGSDEFIATLDLPNKSLKDAVGFTQAAAERIIALVSLPFQLQNQDFFITCSIGVAIFGSQKTNGMEILKQADIATNLAKESGRNRINFFDPSMQQTFSSRVSLEQELRIAIEERQFELYYQAQTNQQGIIIGAEALIRWHHPQRGLVSPDEFIPLAEATGQIIAIGDWVLDTALLALKRWQDTMPGNRLRLSINLSAEQLHTEHLHVHIKSGLDQHQLSPELLILELTESILIENSDTITANLDSMRQLGLHFSIDDFGTGYSSLAYLNQLPVSELKIDQSFVQSIVSPQTDISIIKAIIEMSHALGKQVIAEGVETLEQFECLRKLGCDAFQGYLFSKPLPMTSFETLVRQGITLPE